MRLKYSGLMLLLLWPTIIKAEIISVPVDLPSIQTAIQAASDGDTILVSPGTYFENINFMERNVFLTSYYLYDSDTGYIRQTIINGSNPSNPDTASCILIINGQDSTTVVQGFTITGGKGTAWKDEHSAGTYREGGGILIALSSPIIRYNLISGNEAVNKAGLAGTGGGGIRCGDGRPKIVNNVIFTNKGRYGGGIVLNFCAAILRNNIIANNEGGEDYGGGGVWINGGISINEPNLLENNTIVNNHSATDGGGILYYNSAASVTLKNNIIFGNSSVSSNQIEFRGAPIRVTYTDIEDSVDGTGNINNYSHFTDTCFYLADASLCIDAGDTNSGYKDPVDPENPEIALFPSKGTLRNDMGAYGGPGATYFPFFEISKIRTTNMVSFGSNNIEGVPVKQKITLTNQSTDSRDIDSVVVMNSKENLLVNYFSTQPVLPSQSDSIIIEWSPAVEEILTDTLLIYHNALNTKNPLKLSITGRVHIVTDINATVPEKSTQNFPNPFSSSTLIKYSVPGTKATLIVYSSDGIIIRTITELNPSGIVQFDGSDLSNGIYTYKLISSDKKVVANKMILFR